MSQVIKNLASGPVPPTVPTQFTADDATIAIPAGNNLNVFSRDTTDNNNNGVQTTADPNASDNLFLELTNRITGIATTTDGVTTQTIYNFPLGAVAGTYLFNVSIVGYNVTDSLSAAYTSFGTVRTDGAVGTLINGQVGVISEETDGIVDMTAVNVFNSVVGNSFLLEVIGIAGTTINWFSLTTYIFIA